MLVGWVYPFVPTWCERVHIVGHGPCMNCLRGMGLGRPWGRGGARGVRRSPGREAEGTAAQVCGGGGGASGLPAADGGPGALRPPFSTDGGGTGTSVFSGPPTPARWTILCPAECTGVGASQAPMTAGVVFGVRDRAPCHRNGP